MSLILFLISFILVVIIVPIGIILTTIFNFKKLNKYYFNLAISLDQFGNVAMSGMFNLILIKSSHNLFGNPDETISSVLGKNKLDGNLMYLGRRLDALLNGIDKNHSIKSIEQL